MKAPEQGSSHYADLALRNGVIWTVESQLPSAQAVAIAGNRIVAVGDDAQIDALIGPQTHVHDLQGRLALSGFQVITHAIGG